MTVNELAQANHLLVIPFDYYCGIDGCLNTAVHLATHQAGKRIEECQLCNQHYIELSRKLTQATKQVTP